MEHGGDYNGSRCRLLYIQVLRPDNTGSLSAGAKPVIPPSGLVPGTAVGHPLEEPLGTGQCCRACFRIAVSPSKSDLMLTRDKSESLS